MPTIVDFSSSQAQIPGAYEPGAALLLLSIQGGPVTDLFSGRGAVRGNVFVKGTPNTPASRRVRLLRERDGKIVREQWSDAVTGAYSFEEIDASITYVVIVSDHERVFRAEVADNITPTVP